MKIAIIGRTEFLYDTALRLHALGHRITCVLTAKEAPEYKRTAADFEALAEQWGIPFAQGPRIIDHTNFLKASSSDIAVSINYTGVVPQEVIDIFPLGILNAHAGDLPRYRGNATLAWPILNGEERIGLCIHRMIGGELDSGDILSREYLKIDHNTKIGKVWDWMARLTPHLMSEAIEKLERNPDYILEIQSKNPMDALRCYPRKPEDAKIDWGANAIDVLRLINASNRPYSGAFCELDGDNIIVWDAELVVDDEQYCAVSGQVTKVGDGYIEVACGIGKLRVLLVEYQGKMSEPSEIVKSIRKRLK